MSPPLLPASAADHALAADIARLAGEVLLSLRGTPHLHGAALGAAGDAIANELIVRVLREQRPDDGLLTEEAAPDLARLAKRRVWIVDPLDGTREYSEAGRSDWAVHIALAIDGVPVVGAVALPVTGRVYATGMPPALAPAPPLPLKIVVSRTRPPEIARRVAHALGAELLPLGSAGAKAMAVVAGEAHAYLHAGGLSEWDSCAPVAVALAAGLHASRIGGDPCTYNRAEVSIPDLLICRPEHAAALLASIADAHRH